MAEDFIVKDSGKRQEFGTGAVRDIQEGKGRFDLIPSLPLRRLAKVYERGATKYTDNNWQKGIPLSRLLDSAERHINSLKAGEPTEDHAAQAIWNLFSYIWTLAEIEAGFLPKELDNRPLPEPQYRKREEKVEARSTAGALCLCGHQYASHKVVDCYHLCLVSHCSCRNYESQPVKPSACYNRHNLLMRQPT